MTITTQRNHIDNRSRLAMAIHSTLDISHTFTDLIIHEGQTIKLKSAAGTRDLSETGKTAGQLVVQKSDFQHFFNNIIGGQSLIDKSGDYWTSKVLPTLLSRQSMNQSLQITNSTNLRFSLFLHNRGQLGMIVRISSPPPALDSIGLTEQILKRIKTDPRGLLIITGPTASGKTATALSILDWFNHNGAGHIVTIEDPIEYPMESDKCLFTQREVGSDVDTFSQGLFDAMRLSPEALLCGEIRDRESAQMAIMGGESGALMLVTTHGRSITGTLRKILAFTGPEAPAMREVLAGSLMGVIRQELVPLADGTGYTMVCDTLHMTETVRVMVQNGDWAKLDALTNNVAMPSPDFVPMNTKITELIDQKKINLPSFMNLKKNGFPE
jgi:twitching motility protein PilT